MCFVVEDCAWGITVGQVCSNTVVYGASLPPCCSYTSHIRSHAGYIPMKPAPGIANANLQTLDAVFSEIMNVPRLTKDTQFAEADMQLAKNPWVPMSASESQDFVDEAMGGK